MLFLGAPTLGEGFRLIGFEVLPDPSREELEQLLGELMDAQQNAFVVIDQGVAEQHSSVLERVRSEGGRIVITGVPPLHDPECFHCALDDRISALLGSELVGGES
jgi:vacuolar-type H+-ATPase subunit F/Vma7